MAMLGFAGKPAALSVTAHSNTVALGLKSALLTDDRCVVDSIHGHVRWTAAYFASICNARHGAARRPSMLFVVRGAITAKALDK